MSLLGEKPTEVKSRRRAPRRLLAVDQSPTPHPCDGRPANQRRAFEAIAVGQHHYAGPRTIAALLKAELIVRRGGDKFAVPLAVRWCRWAAERSARDISK